MTRCPRKSGKEAYGHENMVESCLGQSKKKNSDEKSFLKSNFPCISMEEN